MDVNTVHTTEFVKENRNPDTGAVTSLTIKLSAYEIPAEVSYTGDGNYLNHNDTTYKHLTIVDKEYYDYDLCTSLASTSFIHTLPTDQQTSITQDLDMLAENRTEQIEYYDKRVIWCENYQNSDACHNSYRELYTVVANL
jgi:hypothetical protein